VVEGFIKELCALLGSANGSIRDAAKDFLGREVTGKLLIILLTHFEKFSQRLFAFEGDIVDNPRNLSVVQCFVSVLKSIVDRADTCYSTDIKEASARIDLVYTNSFDIASLVYRLGKFISNIKVANGSSNPELIKLKLRVCEIFHSLILKKDLIGLGNDGVSLVNDMILIIARFNSEYKKEPTASFEAPDNLKSSLDVATLKSISLAFKSIPLKCLRKDSAEFLEIFGCFARVLDSCKIVEVSSL
jgi:hypothetical protein